MRRGAERRLGALKLLLSTSRSSKKTLLIVIIPVILYVLLVLIPRVRNILHSSLRQPVCFYSTDNYTGSSSYVVPNIIHFVRFGQPNISFIDAVGIRSAYINHAPDKIVVHCDVCRIEGPYGYLVRDIPIITFEELQPTNNIFGRNVTRIHHASDIARVQVLLKYGGIYLDNDCIVIRPLHQFRHFEMTIGWSPGAYLASMVLLAAPGARFLHLHRDLYREYKSSLWYYNVGDLPTMRLLWPHPHLIHAVPVLFGIDMDMLRKLYTPGLNIEWRRYFAVHTLIRHRCEWRDPLRGRKIDMENIRTYNTSLGEMIREVLFGTSAFVSNDTKVKPVADLYAVKPFGRTLAPATVAPLRGQMLKFE